MTPKKLQQIKNRNKRAKKAWRSMPLCPPTYSPEWFAGKLMYEDVPALIEEIEILRTRVYLFNQDVV